MFEFSKKHKEVDVDKEPHKDKPNYIPVLHPVFRRQERVDYGYGYQTTKHTDWEEIRTSHRRVELDGKDGILVECFKKTDTQAEHPFFVHLNDLKFPAYYS